jgi:hypothetical protein
MFCSPRQRASYEANQCLKRAPDFAAIDDATCGRVASELPVASALLIWRVIAQKPPVVLPQLTLRFFAKGGHSIP